MQNTNLIKNKFQMLTQKLKLFGLDPRDWHIIELPNGLIVIQNNFESEFTLLGRSSNKKKKWEWTEIQLAEI